VEKSPAFVLANDIGELNMQVEPPIRLTHISQQPLEHENNPECEERLPSHSSRIAKPPDIFCQPPLAKDTSHTKTSARRVLFYDSRPWIPVKSFLQLTKMAATMAVWSGQNPGSRAQVLRWHKSIQPLKVDIVGDFAGKELFAIHGEAMLAHCVREAKVDFNRAILPWLILVPSY
jgi:hypothetical protein